ncbi:hypothetical protein RchiOBHm_Chr6g0269721 [Rosa chinensis]|uniref:Uncharacterized protein n=1 Tax=Rosa chinensis TaxID=74649 RepID=A0A2P6PQH0_ROSCH|nr:hypothetical protein RchiOBHm_Chr6g0269721 [Rosa chinensis]
MTRGTPVFPYSIKATCPFASHLSEGGTAPNGRKGQKRRERARRASVALSYQHTTSKTPSIFSPYPHLLTKIHSSHLFFSSPRIHTTSLKFLLLTKISSSHQFHKIQKEKLMH